MSIIFHSLLKLVQEMNIFRVVLLSCLRIFHWILQLHDLGLGCWYTDAGSLHASNDLSLLLSLVDKE